MGLVTKKPDFSQTMPDVSASGIKLLEAITANKIWNESSLQYYLGGSNALALDSDFKSDLHSMFGNVTPDSVFQFTTVTQNAFKAIDNIVPMSISQTNNPDDAEQVIISVDKPSSDTEGFFDFPGTYFHDGGQESWSLGAFNSGLGYMLKAGEEGGGQYANWTIIHEIGHSLGLKHTHQEASGLPPLPEVGKFMDNEMYSVMSYNPASSGTTYGHAVTMMGLDVAALQALYGKSVYADGDSTYTLNDPKNGALDLTEGDVSIGRAYYCIWDSGGDDTIRYGGSKYSALINLNDATLDTKSNSSDLTALFGELKVTSFYKDLSHKLQQEIVDTWHHAGGFFSHVLTKSGGTYQAFDGGYSIAHDAGIENASGGGSGDLLIGNTLGNFLAGLAGGDTMLGGDGADTLQGGAGNDVIDGGRGDDMLFGGAGRDRFVFSDGYGTDTIGDFSHGDTIDLKKFGLNDFSDFNQLYKNYMTDVGGSTHITIGGDTLIVEGVAKADLTSSDFVI